MLDFVIALASYFVEWIPNNATAAPGEWPWQGADRGGTFDPNG